MDGSPTIVLADDDAKVRELLRHALGSAGYAVEAFETGDECWQRLETGEAPDLVLLDVVLPGLDGPEVLELIRRDERLTTVPVVFLTGRGSDDDAVADCEAVPDDHITKPFSPIELRDRLGELL